MDGEFGFDTGDLTFDLGEIDFEIDFSFGDINVDLDIDITGGTDNQDIDPTQGTDGSDTFSGTAAADVYFGNGGDDFLSGGGERDTLNGGDGNDTIDGGDRADTLNGDAGDDFIIGGSGGDQIDGGTGSDVIDAGDGQDLVYGGDGDDVILLGEGIDFAYGDAGNDTISAGEHSDFIFGGEGDDILNGDGGSDVLYGGAGADAIDGGDGYDISSYSDLTTEGVGVELDAIGEAGSLTISADSTNAWVRVDFAQTLENAQVVIGGISGNDDDPVTARVRNLDDSGFEVRLEEWWNQDGVHGAETLNWLAVESGTHTLENGLTITAGETTATMNFAEVDLGAGFDTGPTVFSQVVTTNDAASVVTRMRSVDGDSFEISLENEEAAPGREAEDIGWIAIDLGGSTREDFLTGITPETLNEDPHTVFYGGNFSNKAELVFMADIQTFNGGDPSWARLDVAARNGARFFIEEEESLDGADHPADEAVGYAALEGGLIYGQSLIDAGTGTSGTATSTGINNNGNGNGHGKNGGNSGKGGGNGGNGSNGNFDAGSTRVIGEAGNVTFEQQTRDQWFRVDFERALDNPVVNLGPVTDDGVHPVATQVRNVTSTGFEFQIDEWIYLNGYHPTETVSWMAIETGDHVLASNGERISAGFADVDGLKTAGVQFDAAFEGTPVVFAQLSSDNSDIPAEARLGNVTADGFEVRLQEEEAYQRPAGNVPHGDETASFIAIQQGGAAADGVLIGDTGDSVTHTGTNVAFDSDFANDPIFLVQMQTTDGGDTANVRTTALDENGAQVFIDEETTRDDETAHTTEVVGFAALFEGLLYSDQSANTGQAAGDTWVNVEQIQGTETDDILQASGSVTVLNGGAGDDILRGGSGADSFEFFAGNGTDRIERFVHNVDKVDLSRFDEAAPVGFGDLTLAQTGADVSVFVGGDVIVVADTHVGLLDQDDFIFA